MTEKKDDKTPKGFSLSVGTRRIIAYIVLVLLTILCLFWFYVPIISIQKSKIITNPGIYTISTIEEIRNLTH